MNREILFRGKRKDNGEWIEGFPVFDFADCSLKRNGKCLCEHNGKLLCFYGWIDELHEYDEVEVTPETVCQYTGLTDKNDRKIYEGDIVQEYPFKAVVRFGEFEDQVLKNIGFNLEWNNIVSYRQDLPYWVDKIEVIGNIFDNSELVKEAEI